MASGSVKKSFMVDLGLVSSLDIDTSDKTNSTVYHFTYVNGTTNAPFNGAGHGYLYTNDLAQFGSQIVYSDKGIAWRELRNSSYRSWVYIVQP